MKSCDGQNRKKCRKMSFKGSKQGRKRERAGESAKQQNFDNWRRASVHDAESIAHASLVPDTYVICYYHLDVVMASSQSKRSIILNVCSYTLNCFFVILHHCNNLAAQYVRVFLPLFYDCARASPL